MNLNPKDFRQRLVLGQITMAEEYLFTFFVSLLCMTVYVASDVFLPSLPEMTEYFSTTASMSQNAISIFLIGLAGSQIFHGLMADKFGKKKVLIIVLPIFLLCTMGCLFSSGIEMLILFRLFQAISASACLVIGRAIFNEFFEIKRAQRAFAILVPLVSLSPALAPAIGGYLATHFQWQASFVFVLFFTLIVTLFVFLYIPDTKPKQQIQGTKSVRVFSALFQMIQDSRFLHMSWALFVSTFLWWIYVAGAPIMLHKEKFTSEQIGLVYFPAIVPYIICAFIGRHLLKTIQAERIVNLGIKVLFFGSFVFPFFVFFGFLNVWTIMFGTIILTAGNGFAVSLSMARGISLFQKQSGLAAGLLGTIQLFSGAIASFCVGVFSDRFDFRFFCLMEFAVTFIGCGVYFLISKSVLSAEKEI